MTDINIIRDMLKRAGIKFSEDTVEAGINNGADLPAGTLITTCDDDLGGCAGYSGFVTALRFDANGALVAAGGYE